MNRLPYVRLTGLGLIAISAAVLAETLGNFRGDADRKAIALLSVAVFVVFAVAVLHVAAESISKLMRQKLGAARAGRLRFLLRLGGYVLIFAITLGLLTVPISQLLFGGAAVAVILSVAAQQSLANVFAGITLMIARPFTIGDQVTIKAGALGGDYTGTVIDMSLTYIQIRCEDGTIVLLPNAGALAGALIPQEPFSPPADAPVRPKTNLSHSTQKDKTD